MLFSDTPHIANYNSTIFKTINGDFKLFNQTLVSTNGNISKSASGMSKLSTAFERYNSLSTKSASFQKAYNNALVNNNTALGKYLSGLNGAKATMGGYIKSLVSAKVATIGLQVASLALNTAITMGVSLAISSLVSQITKWANAQEDARRKAIELTNTYKEQKNSLDWQIKKYKELKETLDKGNLSTDESRSIKEQLLEIQNSLIESYGDEASNIDLVNGKYREQLGLLGELSKEKATEHVTENRDVFSDAKEALEKERNYNLGTVTSWNTYSPQTEDQKKLLDYIEAYSELLDLTHTRTSGRGVTATSVSVSVKADVASADELMHQFATDLEKYGEENDIDVSGILEGISGQLKETWTDELTEYKTVYDEFMKAEIVRNDTLRPLYQESIQAVEDYNKALSTGEGIEEAKANLESVQQSVQSATGELEGSQSVFDGIYEGINKDAEAIYDLGKTFENDKTVQNYAEQLRGLTDVDLKAINLDNTNTEKGEEAFKGLMETLGLTEEQVQSLIDKLVELGYVQGEVQGSTPDDKTTVLDISSTVDKLNTQLKPTIDSLADAYNNIFTTDGFTRENIGLDMFSSIREELDNLQKSLEESGSSAVVDYSAYEKLVSVLNDADSSAQQIKDAFDEVALYVANVSITGLEDFQVLKESLEQLGYVDADLVAFEALVGNMEALKEAGLDLTNADLTKTDLVDFVQSLGISAEYATQAVDMLTFAQQLNKANSLDTSASVSSLLQLATDAGYTGEIIQWLTQLMKIYNYLEQKTLKDPQTVQDYIAEAEMLTNKIKEAAGKINVAPNENTIDWKPLQKSASKAGKDAGKSYKEALEEELSNLGDVISYVGDIIGDQIDLWEDQKDAAVDALEAERDAAIEALEAQKESLELQKEAIEDKIEAKEKEIKAIQDAREERQAEIDLQKKQYDLERLQNQKTRLIYKEGNDGVPGQMVYETDLKEVRNARESVDEAKENLQILAIEKEIDVLEESIDAIDDQIEHLDKQIENVNKHYDELIKQTEAYYDSMIQGLEDYKSRWEELANIEKEAKMQVALKNLGIETTDILNMSEEAFNSFKNQYLSILTQMYNGETDMINAINSVAQGLDTTTLETGLIKTKENIDKLNNADFTSVKTGLDSVSTGMDSVGNSASTASTNTSAVSDDLQKMNQSTEGLDTKLSGVATALDSIPTRDKFDGLTEACSSLGEAIERISKALGVSDGSVSGLVTALQEISTISLMGEDGKGGIISQFQSLKTAVDEVTSAINGGGAMNVEATAGTTASPSRGGEGEQGGGAGGLTGAIKEIGTTTDETMGTGGSESGEGSASSEGGEGDGVLGKFSAFKDSVDAVTKAIGTGEEETGSEEGASTLIGALQLHYEKAEETLPQVKSRFEELLESITACVEKLSELAGAMSSLGGGGGGGSSFSLFAKGTDPNTSFSGMVGKAFAKGTGRFKGLSKDEPLAITSEYGQPETIIPPDGNAMITTSPTAMSLKKGTVILNEEQTKEMLNNKPEPVYRELGKKTFELGVDYDIVDGRPKFKIYLNPDDFANRSDYLDEVMSRFNFSNTFEASRDAFTKPLYSIQDKLEKMTEQISNVNNNYNNNQSVTFGDIHVHCSGITSEEVAEQTVTEIQRSMFGLSNKALQKSSITR